MLVVDKQKYNMSIFEAKKELHVQVLGFLTEDVVEEYMVDFQDTINKVPKKDYRFVVDATYQSPVPAKIAGELGQTMLFYGSLGFKEVIVIKPKSKIAQVQIRNALELVDFPGTFVDSGTY